MKTFYAIILLAAITVMGCDPMKLTSDSGDPHATKIIVSLAGKYAADEIVDVTIGSGGVTTIGKDQPAGEAYATVEPGTYAVIGTPRGVDGSWSTSTKVEAGQQKRIVLNCDDAKLTVKPDILWAGTHNRFLVTVYNADRPVTMIVGAGLSGEVTFRPGKSGNMIDIRNADNGTPLTVETHKFFYGGSLTLTLPYK